MAVLVKPAWSVTPMESPSITLVCTKRSKALSPARRSAVHTASTGNTMQTKRDCKSARKLWLLLKHIIYSSLVHSCLVYQPARNRFDPFPDMRFECVVHL